MLFSLYILLSYWSWRVASFLSFFSGIKHNIQQILVMTKAHIIHRLVSEDRKGEEKAQRVTEVLSKSTE